MGRDFVTPLVAILVGAATGIYTFQPLILEQLKKDGNLNPKYEKDLEVSEATFGDLTDQRSNEAEKDQKHN